MAGWDYIIGETAYDQPFVLFDKGTGKAVNGTGITAQTMTILDSDLTATSPAINNVVLALVTANPLKVKLAVAAGTPNVPQTIGSYLVTITVTISGEVRKTFELDLRVYNG